MQHPYTHVIHREFTWLCKFKDTYYDDSMRIENMAFYETRSLRTTL